MYSNVLDGYWYVIDHSVITGTNRDGSSYLGRPWRNYARVIFQNSWLDSNVNRTGWASWVPGDERTNHTLFGEHLNLGPSALGPRASFGQKLSKPVDIVTVLNDTAWVDPVFLKLQLPEF